MNFYNYLPVSIVIPCYNYGRFLAETIASVENSTVPIPRERIIVVNDGSDEEETIAVLNKLRQRGIQVIDQQPNLGVAAARNTGFNHSETEFVLPLDADDLIHPTTIEKMWWALTTHPAAGFVTSWLKRFGNDDWIWHPPSPNPYRILFENTATSASLVRKSAWQEVSGYDEAIYYYEDWDFWIKIFSQGWFCYQIPEVLLYYRRHGHSLLEKSNERRVQAIAAIQRKYPDLYDPANIMNLKRKYGMKDSVLLKDLLRKILIATHCYPVIRKMVSEFKCNRTKTTQSLSSLIDMMGRSPEVELKSYRTSAAEDARKKVAIFIPPVKSERVLAAVINGIKGMVNKGWRTIIFCLNTLEEEYWLQLETLSQELFILPNFIEPPYYLSFIASQCGNKNVSTLVALDKSGAVCPRLSERLTWLIRRDRSVDNAGDFQE